MEALSVVDADPLEHAEPEPSGSDGACEPLLVERRAGRCRTNSRRGLSDPGRRSYPPVESVRRALEVLRTVSRLRIASVTDIYAATGLPKPTIIRMLETLIADGYVARDNMFGGYRVTCQVHELTRGYGGISMVIEASRLPAIELTRRIKWPIGIGVLDGDALSIQFWTGAISPWAHTNTTLGLRPNLFSSAMGRAYVAFCPEAEREAIIASLRADPDLGFTDRVEADFRRLLAQLKTDGFAVRDPRTEPRQMTTLAMPLMCEDRVMASVSVSFYKTAVPIGQIRSQIVKPLRETRVAIERNLALLKREVTHAFDAGEPDRCELAPLLPG